MGAVSDKSVRLRAGFGSGGRSDGVFDALSLVATPRSWALHNCMRVGGRSTEDACCSGPEEEDSEGTGSD